MTAYQPVCRYCRTNEPSFYISCPGCQVRRKKALDKWASGKPLPAPSEPRKDDSR